MRWPSWRSTLCSSHGHVLSWLRHWPRTQTVGHVYVHNCCSGFLCFPLTHTKTNTPQSHHFQVMAHTRSLCEAGGYTVNDEQWMLPHPSPSFAWKPTDDSPTTSRRRTEVKVSNHCSLTAAQLTRKASKHGRILVLNMANRTNPGGRCETDLEVGTVGKWWSFVEALCEDVPPQCWFCWFHCWTKRTLDKLFCKQYSWFVAKWLARRLQEGKQSSGGGPFQTNHSELRFGQRIWSCCDLSNGRICSNHLPWYLRFSRTWARRRWKFVRCWCSVLLDTTLLTLDLTSFSLRGEKDLELPNCSPTVYSFPRSSKWIAPAWKWVVKLSWYCSNDSLELQKKRSNMLVACFLKWRACIQILFLSTWVLRSE